MKTKKLKENATTTEQLAWKLECSQWQDKYGIGSVLIDGQSRTYLYDFTLLAKNYEIILRPEIVPYTADTVQGLIERAGKEMVRYVSSGIAYNILWIDKEYKTAKVCNCNYDFSDLHDDFVWANNNDPIGTEEVEG